MSKKYTVDELLRLACIYAQQDRETLAGCCAEDDPAGIEARNLQDEMETMIMKEGDPVVLLVDLEVKPAGFKIPAGTIGTLQVIERDDDHYEVEFDEDQLFIVTREQFRLASADEAKIGYVPENELRTCDDNPF